MILKLLLPTFVILLLSGCNSIDTSRQADKGSKKIEAGRAFFDFDEIEYYNNSISNMADVFKNSSKSEEDSLRCGLLIFNTPMSIADTLFIPKLDNLNYLKKTVDTSKFSEINQIFTEKQVQENIMTFCEPSYRNLLIFRKRHAIVGIAKICFGCMYNQIVGSSANTQNFGQDGDYKRLSQLLIK